MPTNHEIPYDEQQRRAHAIYNAQIRSLLSPSDAEKYVMVDILTGDYEIGDNEAKLTRLLRTRRPDAVMHAIRRHQSISARIRITQPVAPQTSETP